MAPRFPLAAIAALLAGCTSVAPDGGFGSVAQMARERTGQDAAIVRTDADARALDASLQAILQAPLGADDAVRIALLNNPSLQATYWKVGIAQADLAEAGRLHNPSLNFKRIHSGADIEIERILTFNLIGALTAPLQKRIEARRFEQAKLEVAGAIEKHAHDTRRAWYEAVAARQNVEYARQVNKAAEASADLTGRMAKAGNASRLELAREQAFYAEASAGVARAGKEAVAAREKLTRLLGLWGQNAAYTLPDHLPDLPAAAAELNDIERIAMNQRLDVQAAKLQAAQTASSLGLNRATRFVNVLDLGAVRTSATGLASAPGYEITLELPLFDWGSARVAKAEATYMQSLNHVAQAATDARSEARESYLDYRASYDLARHYRDVVIPLRKSISDEMLLRYNGMLVSATDLLADSREQAAAVNAYITALKEFWIAHANLEAALGTRVPSTGAQDKSKEQKQ